ncbi:hypothetical protein [Niallia sp. 03190]|uniref:hypothetical protein n=1 Tax=Niallia sp. 03190 TaxID=3458061 RepID=UPI0040442BDE
MDIKVLKKMDDLLFRCKTCDKNEQYFSPEICEGCSIYKQLREIGDSFGKADRRRPERLNLTVEEFVQHRFVGKLKYKEIANIYGLTFDQVSAFNQNHKKKIKKYLEEMGIS